MDHLLDGDCPYGESFVGPKIELLSSKGKANHDQDYHRRDSSGHAANSGGTLETVAGSADDKHSEVFLLPLR